MPAPEPVRVVDAAGAARLAEETLAVMAALEAVIAAETAHVRAGRLREGLAEEARKGELSARYMQAVAALKANAVAMARFVPGEVARLKAAHQRFAGLIETNQTVLATARTVSEGLMRTISETLRRSATPEVYGSRRTSYGGHGAPRSEPLVLSRNL